MGCSSNSLVPVTGSSQCPEAGSEGLRSKEPSRCFLPWSPLLASRRTLGKSLAEWIQSTSNFRSNAPLPPTWFVIRGLVPSKSHKLFPVSSLLPGAPGMKEASGFCSRRRGSAPLEFVSSNFLEISAFSWIKKNKILWFIPFVLFWW